jgi:hypothetical protein
LFVANLKSCVIFIGKQVRVPNGGQPLKNIRFDSKRGPPLNPKEGGGGGPNVPTGQEIACHFSQDHAMVTKILDFIHKHLN